MTFTRGHSIDAPLFVENAAKACIEAWVRNDMQSTRKQARVILDNLDICPRQRVEWSIAYIHGRVTNGEIHTSYGLLAADDGGKPTLTLYATPTVTRLYNTAAAAVERIPDWEFSLNQEGRMEFHPHPRSEETSQFLASLQRR